MVRYPIGLLFLAILLGSASLVGLGSADVPLDPIVFRIRYGLVAVSLGGLLLLGWTAPWFVNRDALFLPILWFFFSLAMVFSGLANENLETLRDGFWLMLAVPLLFFRIVPSLLGQNTIPLVSWGLILGHLPYLVLSVIQVPITAGQYRGIFSNSNQLGLVGVTAAMGFLMLLSGTIVQRRSSWYRVGLLLGFMGTLALTLVSNARTSLLTLGLMVLLLLLQGIPHPRFLQFLLCSLGGVGGVVTVYFWQPLQEFIKSVETGYLQKIADYDAFNGRTDIWQKTIADARLFGYGTNDYFLNLFGHGGHNTLIDTLGKNGLIAAYLLLGLAIASFYYSFQHFLHHRTTDPYAIAPLMLSTGFWMSSLGESMFGALGKGMTLAYLIALGVLISDSRPIPSFMNGKLAVPK
jgi:hypothetical protein